MVERLYLAAMSSVDLPTACRRLRERFALPEFVSDVEAEGDDWWSYAHADGPQVAFNVTRVGRFVRPSAWGWMWGVPDLANYQVIVWGVSGEAERMAERAVAEVLECPVVRYPGSGPAEQGATADRPRE